MLVIAALLLGAGIGVLRARKRGGNRLDIAQHAAVYALILGLVALFASIFIEREMGNVFSTAPEHNPGLVPGASSDTN